MQPNNTLAALSGLIVSCQPVSGGALDRPDYVANLSVAVTGSGATALRLEGIENIRATRKLVSAPIIGLIKRDLADSSVRITPYCSDVDELAAIGCDVIAYDATDRPRPESTTAIVRAIHAAGKLAFADCAQLRDGVLAIDEGADIVGTTLSGYAYDMPDPSAEVPDLELVSQLASIAPFVIAEGRYWHPETVKKAIQHGAKAVVVGTAITRPEITTKRFADAIVDCAI